MYVARLKSACSRALGSRAHPTAPSNEPSARLCQLFVCVCVYPSLSIFPVQEMPCARCGEWIVGQWLHWIGHDPTKFLPVDVWHVVRYRDCWDTACISYFFCDTCRLQKFMSQRWTPGCYTNADGYISTDEDDEEFITSLNSTSSVVISSWLVRSTSSPDQPSVTYC